MSVKIEGFFDPATYTISYVVSDEATKHCAIIDSVLDYCPDSGRTGTDSADRILAYIAENDLKPRWILETHIHADHLSAAPYLKEKLGGKTGIGNRIQEVQQCFGDLFNAEAGFHRDGSQFDSLFADGTEIPLGQSVIRVMHTPGHTPACTTYVVEDAAFVGDTLFMPDYGTARCDFPGGDARQLYQSIQKIFTLPDSTRLFMCHDYLAPGREDYRWETTVAEERAQNVHIGNGVSEDEFAEYRERRDKTLSLPKLMLPSVQVNMRAGEMPPPEDNGKRYLKIPVNLF
ncbi:MBL fold metallo-hydrolase [Biformimicrobium ophioploci]|uniref:MBL fold metallo-hydrolase n=1 Tax=Biformimicrobium ophioploci TaxID=3036711 RepID=A0ABQ6LZN8_9GAMM|nr:MBL fold metallo-hydrolase [Microbulbifer sp. NKW57]GMG87565.1 MBL fold metallo-hydrolase [Microbulbifer sp. NKW57]